MTHTFKLARRAARFRAPLLLILLAFTIGACDSADRLTDTSAGDLTDPAAIADPAAPVTTPEAEAALEDSLAREDSLATATDPAGGQPILDGDDGMGEMEEIQVAVVDGPDPAAASVAGEGLSLASAFRGGIPFGAYHLPGTQFGSIYNGSITSVSERGLITYLQQARRAGAKVMISFAGSEKNFKNANMSFSITKWKALVARYRAINVSSYIKDGTLVAHYLMDEPHDPANWGGRLVSRATIDELARYSKLLWPTLPTAVRAWPKYLKGYNYRYLDAAWAQYAARFGSVPPWLSANVRDAKAAGLALVVGMNTLAGSNSSGLRGYYSSGYYSMTASQLRTWGGSLLSNSYPCAFLGWKHNARYYGRSDIKSAMGYLASKARARATKTCRGT